VAAPAAAPPPGTLSGFAEAAAPADASAGAGGVSGLLKGVAVGSVVIFMLVAGGASDLVAGTQGARPAMGTATGAAALSAASKAKLEKLVSDFEAAPDPAALPRGQALAAAQAASRLERYDAAAAAYAAAVAAPGAVDDLFEALPGRVEALLKAGRPQAALDEASAFASAHPDVLGAMTSDAQYGGLDACDVALLRAKALAALPGRQADADALLDELVAARPDDFRPLLAKGLSLREQDRQLAADKALVRARFLAPKEARKMVDALIGDR
jgi:hypothetical protein